jgi:hypothetical protein
VIFFDFLVKSFQHRSRPIPCPLDLGGEVVPALPAVLVVGVRAHIIYSHCPTSARIAAISCWIALMLDSNQTSGLQVVFLCLLVFTSSLLP